MAHTKRVKPILTCLFDRAYRDEISAQHLLFNSLHFLSELTALLNTN